MQPDRRRNLPLRRRPGRVAISLLAPRATLFYLPIASRPHQLPLSVSVSVERERWGREERERSSRSREQLNSRGPRKRRGVGRRPAPSRESQPASHPHRTAAAVRGAKALHLDQASSSRRFLRSPSPPRAAAEWRSAPGPGRRLVSSFPGKEAPAPCLLAWTGCWLALPCGIRSVRLVPDSRAARRGGVLVAVNFPQFS